MRRSETALRYPLLLAMLTVLPLSAAQESGPVVIKVGEPTLDGSFIQPVKNRLKITQITSKGAVLDNWGSWTDDIQLIDWNGRSALKRTQVVTTPDNVETTVCVVDRKTLAPIWSDLKDNRRHVRYDFADGSVRVQRSTVAAGGETKESQVKLDMPVFDFFGGEYTLLFAALPLQQGYTGRFPTLNKDDDSIRWIDFRVRGQEVVDAGPGRKMEAWVVESTIKSFRLTFYVSKQAPYMIRGVNFGPKGGVTKFDMI